MTALIQSEKKSISKGMHYQTTLDHLKFCYTTYRA